MIIYWFLFVRQVWSSQGVYLRCLGQGEEGLPGVTSPAAIMLSPKGRRLAILDAADSRYLRMRTNPKSSVKFLQKYLSNEIKQKSASFNFQQTCALNFNC